MRQAWLWILICVVGVAAILFFGARVSTVLVMVLFIACCGGMMFGMGRMTGKNVPKSRQSMTKASVRHSRSPIRAAKIRTQTPNKIEFYGWAWPATGKEEKNAAADEGNVPDVRPRLGHWGRSDRPHHSLPESESAKNKLELK